MHFRKFPAVKMLKRLQIRGPLDPEALGTNRTLLPSQWPCHYRHPSTRLEALSICKSFAPISWQKITFCFVLEPSQSSNCLLRFGSFHDCMSGKIFQDAILFFGLERLSRSLCRSFLAKFLTVVMDRPLPKTVRSRTNLDSNYPSFVVDRLFVYEKFFGPTLKILGGVSPPHLPLMCVPDERSKRSRLVVSFSTKVLKK